MKKLKSTIARTVVPEDMAVAAVVTLEAVLDLSLGMALTRWRLPLHISNRKPTLITAKKHAAIVPAR